MLGVDVHVDGSLILVTGVGFLLRLGLYTMLLTMHALPSRSSKKVYMLALFSA